MTSHSRGDVILVDIDNGVGDILGFSTPAPMLHEESEGYRLMAADEGRESAALEWAEATQGDVADSGGVS